MVKAQEFTEIYGTRPVWMGDEYRFDNLIVNGAILKPESVPAGKTLIPSGSLVGRAANQKKFTYIAANTAKVSGNFVTRNDTALTENAAQGATVVKVADTDGFYQGLSINVGSNTNTILSVNHLAKTITLTGGLASLANAGAVVRYAANQNMTEVYLTATEIGDISANSEFTQYRHGRMVYINFLPDYATFHADVLAEVRAKYHYITAIA